MSPRNKILSHPDKEDIVTWLTDGESVREIEKRLGERYPRKNQHHLRVSASTIQAFKSKHLQLKGKVLNDVKEHARLAQQLVKMHTQQEEVEATSAYQTAIAKIAETELNTNEQIIKVFYIVENRIEALFERVSDPDSQFLNKDAEKLLQGYLDQFMKAFESHKKYIEGVKDTADTNININIMNDQVTILRESIRETLMEMEPEFAMNFMDKLNIKMRDLVYSGKENSVPNAAFLDRALGVDYEV
jgi:hypothetical protein